MGSETDESGAAALVRPAIISHRGNGFGFRENTLGAFRAVAAHGGFGVELDVRLTRDAIPVVHHDRAVARPSARRAPIDRLARAALPSHVPLLLDALCALDTLHAGGVIDVEIKPTSRSILPVLEVLYGRRVRVSSFDPRVLRQMQAHAPTIPGALLVGPGARLASTLRSAARLSVEGVHIARAELASGFVEPLMSAGLHVRAYTLNSEADWALADSLGLDAIITDRPRRALAFFTAAAQTAE